MKQKKKLIRSISILIVCYFVAFKSNAWITGPGGGACPHYYLYNFHCYASPVSTPGTLPPDNITSFTTGSFVPTATTAANQNDTYDDYNNPCYVSGIPEGWNCDFYLGCIAYISPNEQVNIVNNLYTTSTEIHDYYAFDSRGNRYFIASGIQDGTYIAFFNSQPDEYNICCCTEHTVPTSASDATSVLFVTDVILIPKVTNIWIDAPTKCTSDVTAGIAAGGSYNFQIHTNPEMGTFMMQQSGLEFNVGHFPYGGFDADGFPLSCLTNRTNTCYINQISYMSPNYVLFSDAPFSTVDYVNYQIPYSSFNLIPPHVTTPYLSVSYTDLLGTTVFATAPIIVLSNSPSAISMTSIPTIGGPPNATGTPDPAFDMYNYTVSGFEVWSKTNNPMANMNGSAPYSIIRIEGTLEIQPGATLTITDGMTIEMGPGANIIVDAGSSSSDAGGLLVLAGSSTLTGYSDCNGQYSLWNGVTVMGNPSYAQGTWPLASMPAQGEFVMNSGTISYATIGIQNGGNIHSSGGVILCNYGTNYFISNLKDVNIFSYSNIVSGSILNSIDMFAGCTFQTDADFSSLVSTSSSTAVTTGLIKVWVEGNKGVQFSNCLFIDNQIPTQTEYGIGGVDAGFDIYECTFNQLKTGILALGIAGTSAYKVDHSTFQNCLLGIDDESNFGSFINNNKFYIPKYTGGGAIYYPDSRVVVLNDQNIGTLLKGSTGFNVSGNIFETNCSTPPYYYYPHTTGTLEWNTGSDPNTINGNTFGRVGTAMVSNYVNNGLLGGLQYICNDDARVGYDISVLGDLAATGGIYYNQSTDYSSGGGVTLWLSADNIFSTQWHLYDQQKPILYYNYSPNSATWVEAPSHTYGPVSVTTQNRASCPAIPTTLPYLRTDLMADQNDNILQNNANFSMITQNEHYYMTLNDATQSPNVHRDSLYYWAGMMNTASGDLLISNLLIQDGKTDSALQVYNNIITKYALDSADSNEFANGAALMNILAFEKVNGLSFMDLTAADSQNLWNVVNNCTMWAHIRAENWLKLYGCFQFTDTLLYPAAPPPPGAPGVLAVTSLSQGNSPALPDL